MTEKGKVMFSKTSFFEASVRVNDSPTTEVSYNGRTYIEGRKNSEYELFFRNNSSKKIMVIPSVDGLSVLNGKLAGAGSPGFVVDPWGHLTVPGWKVDNKTAAKFEFRPVGDKSNSTYVETLKSDGVDVDSANQGLILFLIFEEKEQFDWNAVKNKINYKAPVEVKHWSPNPNSTGYVPPQSFGICHAMGNSINLATDDNLTINTNGPLFLNASATPFNSSYSSNNARLIPTASATSAQVGTGFGEATDFKTKKSRIH